ncbi:MAG: clostripain-related cysteine peptidase, partial [Promethearchaeota archaeon]
MVKRVLSIGIVSLLLVGLIPYLMLDVEATPDSNNDFTEAVEIFNGDSIVESLDDIDDLTDFYKIYLSGGDKLVANMTVPLGVDFELYLWDSSYNPIDASENDNTLTPFEEVTTTATIEEYYYVNASVYSGSGTYILNFTATANWTIMVYLGDCDLEGDLITDINNMEKLGSDANVNIIVQFDRWDGTNGDPAKDDTSNGDWTDTRRFYVIEDTINPNDDIIRSERLDDTVELPALGDLDSADSQTLIDFVNWTINKYPANYYVLIFGAHGDGWLGLMVETSGFPADEMLNMSDLAYALDEITGGGNNKLDIIGFDACLMAMLEVDYQIRPYVDYTIGSEELLYPWALDDVLANLTNNPSMSPEQLVTQIVDNYNYTYTITSPGYSNLTQSAVNLSKVGDELLVDSNTTALWHFNEGTGDVVYDETLNDNDGTLGPVWGFALEFDGVDDYVKVDDHESLDCSGNTTWELWFNANDLSQVYTRLLSKSSTQGWAIYTNYNIIRLYANISGLWQGILFSSALNVNQWYHLGIVRNGDLWTLYLDGENVDSNTVSGDMKLNTEDVYIGSHTGGNQFFNGTIDEVRISNIARDPSTGYWKQPLTADANTVALWHFDEGIDQYTYNVTTPGNDGVLGSSTGVDSSDPEWVTSAIGHPEWVSGSSALRFDGVNDYVEIPTSDSLNITDEITIEAWIKPKELPSEYETIVGKWDYGTNSRCYWLAHKYTGEISFFISKDGLDYKSLSYPASLNEWAHFAGVFDGNELKLYKNGELVDGPKSYQQSINSEPALHTWIGADGDNSIRYFNGIIDEVRISNRTRTSEEIAENANTHTISAIDTLGNDLRSTLNAYVNYINYSRNSTEEYQTDNNNYIDLYHFAENIYNNVPDVIIQTDALTVMNTIDNCVLNNWNNFDRLNSHGISIYFPKNSTVYNSSYASDPYFYFPQDTCWGEFLVDYYDVPMNNPPSIDSFDPATDPTIYEVHSQTFIISASDPDNNALMYNWYINGSIEEETGDTYTFNANDFSTGIYEIEVYVFDGPPDGVDDGFTEYDYYNWTLTVIPVKNWTFMVYLDGDNNLEGSGIDDFLEMASVGSSAEVNIIVQFDRIMGEDDRYDDWDTCKRYNVTQGMTPTIANELEDIGEINMGEPQTLINFTNWAISNYPAEHYALILWDHGMHWYGVCSDDTTGGDHLNMSELYDALDTIYTDNSNLILDIIDFDACLMGTVEVAYQIEDYGNYMIASEKTEPGAGLDYNNSLDALVNDPSMTPIEFCDQLLSDYENYYLSTLGTPDEYLLDRSFTLSVTDLNTINDLVSAIDNLTMELYNNKESWVNYVNYSRNQTETYDGPYGGDHKVIDLYHFAQQLYRYVPNTTIKLLATELKNATYTTIKNETHGTNPANPEVIVENAHGLTIYYPVTKGEYDNKYESKPNFYFTQDTYWDEFLNAYYN